MAPLTIAVAESQGRAMPARLSVMGSDQRAYAPSDRWIHADDGFDPQRQQEETRYFHCPGRVHRDAAGGYGNRDGMARTRVRAGTVVDKRGLNKG